MNTDKINMISKSWINLKYKLIDKKVIHNKELQELLTETYDTLAYFSNEELVPKDICILISALKDFIYFYSFLGESNNGIDFEKYQRIDSVIDAILNGFFKNNYPIEFPKLIINDGSNKEIVINLDNNIFK